MNTLTAIQGIDTAFSVTVNPASVDFSSAPALIAEVHRGDGRAALATATPAWANTATDKVTVPFPGTISATLEPGGYFLQVRAADSTSVMSYDVLNILAGVGGLAPLRSLVTPSEAVQLLPDLLSNRPQFTALPGLLAAATELIEAECERQFILADHDGTWPYHYGDSEQYIDLEYPVASIASVSHGPAIWPVDTAQFTTTIRWAFEPRTGQLRVDSSWGWGNEFTTAGPRGRLIRVVYRGGYAVEAADVALGLERVPLPLRKACCMVARSLQEGALVAGPVKTQTQGGRSYTKTDAPAGLLDEVMPLIGQYKRNWVVA